MPQQRKPLRLPLAGTLLLALLVGVSLLAWKWMAKPEHSDPIKKHPVDKPSEETLKYWTAERMRKAKATNMPHIGKPDQGKQSPQQPPQKD